jgi:hypothetical protein
MIGMIAALGLSGCKKQTAVPANADDGVSRPAQVGAGLAEPNASLANSANPSTAAAPSGDSSATSAGGRPVTSEVVPPTARYSDPPSVDVGLSAEQAYAAIPHRRTVWNGSDSSVPAEERAYLQVIFQIVDEAIAVRVAGLQNFPEQRFDAVDVDGQFERLISFVRSMPVPARLGAYHSDILSALSSDRQFFAEWKSQGASFAFARQIAGHPGVRAADGALHAAYGELMSKYPAESQTNKDAFFDYHCALDFL